MPDCEISIYIGIAFKLNRSESNIYILWFGIQLAYRAITKWLSKRFDFESLFILSMTYMYSFFLAVDDCCVGKKNNKKSYKVNNKKMWSTVYSIYICMTHKKAIDFISFA